MTRAPLSISALLLASCAAPAAQSALQAAPAVAPRPSAPAAPTSNPTQARVVVVRVDAAGALSSEGRAETPPALEALVGARAAEGAAEVRLIAAPEARWRMVQAVVIAAMRAGATTIALATEGGDVLALLGSAVPPGILVQSATLAADGALRCGTTEVALDAFTARVRAALSAPAGRANLVELQPSADVTMARVRAAVEAARAGGADSVAVLPGDFHGLLSPEAIRRVVLQHLGEVNGCHERGLAREPNAAGLMAIRFVISGTGAVTSAAVAHSTYPVAEVGECIATAVRQWRFPAPEGGGVVTVNYPFNLQPPEDDPPDSAPAQ